MMTVIAMTLAILALVLFALMAITPLMLESHFGDDVPDNVVHLESRRQVRDDARDAA
ncbi:MAG TPA: hypothetical protein VNZ58_12485 [Thermomicrobiales bacterium]|nr:hypothetical protein [Thermomicrobiales bacterium]